jgi:hypothetical protein
MFSDMYQTLLYYAQIWYIFNRIHSMDTSYKQGENTLSSPVWQLGAGNSINNGGLKLVLATSLRKFYDHHHDLVNW